MGPGPPDAHWDQAPHARDSAPRRSLPGISFPVTLTGMPNCLCRHSRRIRPLPVPYALPEACQGTGAESCSHFLMPTRKAGRQRCVLIPGVCRQRRNSVPAGCEKATSFSSSRFHITQLMRHTSVFWQTRQRPLPHTDITDAIETYRSKPRPWGEYISLIAP